MLLVRYAIGIGQNAVIVLNDGDIIELGIQSMGTQKQNVVQVWVIFLFDNSRFCGNFSFRQPKNSL